MPSDLPRACCVILFGATGDLARRMLFPALYHLHRDGFLPDDLTVMASARLDLDAAGFRARVSEALHAFLPDDELDPAVEAAFLARVHYTPVDVTDGAAFARLADAVARLAPRETVVFLSTGPALYGSICQHLGAAGLVDGRTRVILEKPIGHDLESCHAVNRQVGAVFREPDIFRVDHYLGKETVQNLLALRFANALFEPLWNGTHIDHVQITVAETVGVEGRASYYDGAGALRDMVQNHMLQLLTLVAMEPPSDLDADAVRNEKVKVLRSLRPLTGDEVAAKTVRGQYAAGAIDGAPVPGYRDEGERQGSDTETFVALRADIDNWRWKGVPFYLRTGKRLPRRYSEIFIQFRAVPHSIFAGHGSDPLLPNQLVIRLQPEETIRLQIMNKIPGLDHDRAMRLRSLPLDLSLSAEFPGQRRRIAYERLLLDAIRHNTTLFVRRDEVEQAWAWVDGILDGWARAGEGPAPYAAGTWGPSAAIALTERDGRTWHD
ncbi:glucose-6-phosphate dehydrogenase [Rhodothalassium salexigens]|uniref:glucose-6-phosphate dehydrogenase n=1 Tax=Rhodothalassium salexigens TaxID=1086 RepID=UPI001911D97E|nr:glucose-6-phosphate dehydrogenase [Rhodothalassium salexigens]MBK5912069.1 glucose-6-phosphate dehydrogenase [Rhodothalassium salexigens]MBK5921173.1 glucose-6-phosphate dehydrogenase [Rhodothalassium salexigens]